MLGLSYIPVGIHSAWFTESEANAQDKNEMVEKGHWRLSGLTKRLRNTINKYGDGFPGLID